MHDLAYATAWILLGPDDAGLGTPIDLDAVRSCLTAYEDETASRLQPLERQAFNGYLAGVCLYLTTVAAQVSDPDAQIHQKGAQRMVEIADRILTHSSLAE